jgi:hypothetical protein
VRRVSARLTCLPLRLPWPAGGSRGRPESARLPHIARAPRRPPARGAWRGCHTPHFSRISPCTHTVFSCIFIILIVILPSRVRLRVVHSLVLVSRFVSVHTSLLFYRLYSYSYSKSYMCCVGNDDSLTQNRCQEPDTAVCTLAFLTFPHTRHVTAERIRSHASAQRTGVRMRARSTGERCPNRRLVDQCECHVAHDLSC